MSKKRMTQACRIAAVCCICLVAFLIAMPANAQEARGTITGNVKDANQAVIPGAAVKITNTAMGTNVSITVDGAGFFQAPFLIPGTYSITVEAQNFKKYFRDNILLRVNDRLELDVQMEIGQVGETVTVTSESPVLETTNGSLGQVIDQRRIAELPIAHGDPFKLIGLTGGVSFTGSARLDRPFEPTHVVGYAMDGTRGNRSDITIDGIASTATANAGEVIASFVPPQDLVQEFKVQTATFDAASGNTEGGVTNLSIKSGTNQFHGSAHYVKMPPGLFANDFFANANNVARPDFTYTRWGGTFSGPVWIPKLYNGKNKTFFIYGIEGIPEARPRNDGTPTVPSEKMKQGDFSELLALGPQYQIYNPFTRRAAAGGRFQQDPFAGNIIPANLINPVARKVVDQYFPKPLTAGLSNGTNNFQNATLTENIKYLTNTIRIDHNLSERQRIFSRISWYNRDSDYNNYFNNIATGQEFLFKSRQATFDDVFTLNSTTVFNFRYGYNRFIRGTDSNSGNRGFDLTSIGFPASYQALIPEDIRRFPRFDITGYQGTGVGGEFRPNDTHTAVAQVNKALNRHALKGGVEFRSYRETDRFFGNNQTGQFNFDSTWTRGPLDNAAAAPGSLGQSFASFLLGLPSSGSVSMPADYAEQSTTTGIYIHDDWRFNSKLTLNVGLRYEIEGALTERYNRSVRGFDFGAVQPFEAAARTAYAKNPTPEVPVDQFNLRGGLTFAGVGGQPQALYDVPKKNFMPRFGFAYKLTDKTVIRGGYGIFFGFLGQRRGDVIQSGFSQTTPFVPTLNNGLTFTSTLSNPFPNGLSLPRGAADGPQTFLGQGVTYFNSKPFSPYNQRWQLGVQRELVGGIVGEINYVGNRGTHIEIGRNLNVVPLKYLSTSATRDQVRIDYLSANLPNPLVGLMPSTAGTTFRATNIVRSRLLVPFPQFDAVNTSTNEGYSWYHSLQLDLEKRFSRGYTFGFSYTYSKFMEAIDLLNGADPRPSEVIGVADRPHRMTVNGIYELPFGKGKMFLPKTNAVVTRIVSGWQLQGIYAYQSGVPIGFGNVIFSGDVKNLRLSGDQQTVARWFNTDAGFNKVAAQQLASNVRTFPLRFGSLRSDSVNNYDLSILKNTEVWENKTFQFRAEFLNAFNNPLFPIGNGTTTGIITNPTLTTFGSTIASTQDNYARRIQLALKFMF